MKPKLLYRYIIKTNLYYLLYSVLVCIFIYLLVDLFDRLDNFLNKDAPTSIIISYFSWKIPVIISQIFPLVFFLTFIIQFSIMKKNKEWEAIEGGGIFGGKIIFFIVIYSLFFSSIHIVFSQYIGNYAQTKIDTIWDNLGKKQVRIKIRAENVWFRKGKVIGFIKKVNIDSGECAGITLYVIDDEFSKINYFYVAKYGVVYDDFLKLRDVTKYNPNEFQMTNLDEIMIKGKNLRSILEAATSFEVEDIPIWKLKGIIKEMKKTGTNIEDILTVWYSKISYSLSMVILSLIAFILGTKIENIPFNLGLGLCISFAFYGLFVLGTTLGKSGAIPPFLGAFGVHLLFASFLIYAYINKR